jgi:hypothetical protein
MSDEDYKAALAAASKELETLLAQRAEIDRRIAQLHQTVGSLVKLCGYEPTVPLGITDACRMVLRAAGHPLTVAEVKIQLGAMGVDLGRYENDLAVIHTTLKRLHQNGEVRLVPGLGKPAYQAVLTRTVVLTAETAKALFGERQKSKKGPVRS